MKITKSKFAWGMNNSELNCTFYIYMYIYIYIYIYI